MIRKLFAAAAVVAAVSGFAAAAEMKSGPQVGDKVSPFMPLNINGKSAGEKHCLVCENQDNPVVMIFARNPECPMTQALIKKVEATVAKNEKCEMGSFVVFCTDDSQAEGQAKAFAEKAKLKKVVLSIDSPAGPRSYKVAKDAEVTVVLYTKHVVKANHSFKKDELKDADIEKLLKDVKKITPASEDK